MNTPIASHASNKANAMIRPYPNATQKIEPSTTAYAQSLVTSGECSAVEVDDASPLSLLIGASIKFEAVAGEWVVEAMGFSCRSTEASQLILSITEEPECSPSSRIRIFSI